MTNKVLSSFYINLFLCFLIFSNIDGQVDFERINDSVWIHTTYKMFNGYNVSSNGLIIITSAGLVLIDTPWDDNQTSELIKLCKEKFNNDFTFAIVTHAHDDRIGGISTLKKNKIPVLGSAMTAKFAKINNFETPDVFEGNDTSITIGKTILELYYPGPGHTEDNIVVWLKDYNLLFGGCLIKSEESKTLGNIAEANLKEWPVSLDSILNKFSPINVVIPGHGKWGSVNLIYHSLNLLNQK